MKIKSVIGRLILLHISKQSCIIDSESLFEESNISIK